MRIPILVVALGLTVTAALAQQPPQADGQPTPPAAAQPPQPQPSPAQSAQAQPAPQAVQQPGQPAPLCAELLTYANKKASEPPKAGTAAPTDLPMANRTDGQQTGTQGGGSTGPSSSRDTSNQSAAPSTAPVASGAAPEAAASPHATDQASPGRTGPAALFGGVTVEDVRQLAGRNDWQACRETAQRLRRAGADMPATLMALAALDPARRQPR